MVSGRKRVIDLIFDNYNYLSFLLLLQGNAHFMRKIPQGAEASNILVGEVDFLDKPLSAFVSSFGFSIYLKV